MSFWKGINVLAVLWLAAVFTAIQLLFTSRLDMEMRNLTRCIVNYTCPVCEETRVATKSVPADVEVTIEPAGEASDVETVEKSSDQAEDTAPIGDTTTMAPNLSEIVGSSESNEENSYFRKGKTNFSMEDPGFLQYLRTDIIDSPMPVPYNLEDPFGDPTVKEGQNKVILWLLRNKRNGFFVEAGANQGEYLSNTLVLERDFGWTGLLVEPDEVSYETLLTKHRKAWSANVCLSTEKKPKELEFFYNRRYPIVSHLAEKSNIEMNSKAKDLERKVVKCVPLFSLLLAINLTEVDYFSLDVEGAELDVLKTIPFDRVRIRTMSIEFDHIVRIPGGDEELKTLMKNNGFRLVANVTTGYARDYIFAHSSVQLYL